jgi:hypothetical protein
MVSFSTWRAFYRIPWLRENREAVRILRDMFYLLVALHRADKLQEFSRLRYLYFKMIDSFAQYGQVSARDTVNQILGIPWFREKRRDLYRLIAAYNRVIRVALDAEGQIPSVSAQERINKDMDIFFHALKSLMHFDGRDEDRVNKLLQNRQFLDEMLENLHQSLGY